MASADHAAMLTPCKNRTKLQENCSTQL